MPRHALASELATKLGTTYTGAAGRHVLDGEMPTPTGVTGRHALDAEVAAIVTGPAITTPTFDGVATSRGFTASNPVGAITGCKVGDILVAFVAGNGNNTGLTPPAGQGWTLLADTGTPDAARMYVYTTTATAANQSGGTWTWTTAHNHVVAVVAYDGSTQPTAASTARVAATGTINAPSRTSVGANAMLLTYAFFDTNGTAPAWPVSMTNRILSAASTASGLGAEEARPTAGATGTRTFTAGGTPANMTAATVILEAGP